jgi:O-antigen ligase
VIAAPPLDAVAAFGFACAFAAAAWLTFRRAALGIAALVAAVPFDLPHYLGPTTVTLEKAVLLGVVAGLAARRADARALLAPAARTLLAAALVVAAATALTVVHATYRGGVARETLKALEYALAFAAVVVAARDARLDADGGDERLVRDAIAGTTLLVCALALAQEALRSTSAVFFGSTIVPRIAGPLDGPNQLAAYLGIVLCASAAFALARRLSLLERLALGVGTSALALTLSRAGIASAIVALALVAFASPRRPTLRDVAPFAAGLVAALAAFALRAGLAAHSLAGLAALELLVRTNESDRAGSVGTRSQLWRAALAMWRSQPLLGVGAGNFERDLGAFGLPGIRTHANSLILQSLAEGGLVLTAAALGAVLAPIVRFARGPMREPLVVAALAASVGLALHQLVDLLTFFPKIGIAWWVLAALGAARADAARVGAA